MSGQLPADIRKAIDEKLALLVQIASIAEEQAALAGSLAEPEKAADFDRLLDKRQRCMNQVDVIDKNISTQGYDNELVSKMKTILEHIQDLDRETYEAISKEANVLKNQIADLARRKKGLFTYNTNIMARKSMIVDKSR
ncbi:hypothetical protein L9W92_08025 [Pelotomaculum terephthalicicum JT]|uniref:hypothetical protein n=1 Tax=Pelotomaculum TaxID=191373 RepID=UPI0009D1CD20|nr:MULTISPECIES: hypothetical protein [Pelotomaculum]MCG9968001.1 hypothetical protein [Pelotomaculum terephthalicicum JT]OPX88602.1 MAG: hypothetical protein A4E54_01323 [Pelotomaculum sp. PtaB.Bin117]